MDQDMKAYLDGQFGRIGEQFGRLDEQFGRINEQFARVDERFARIDERFARIDERFDQVEIAIRHTQVSVEGLRGDIRLVAEGVMGVTERLEAFQVETARQFEDVKASIIPYYTSLNGRVKILESRAERQTEDVLDTIRKKFGKPQA